ncbi:putative T7SS-secreted protein [Streptomyces lavendulocolor]|uniref:putative T7SS-secreted protein n=1 Tax=Streptomyces lavendulocolor TaxID=67316 RepID=UPI0034081AB3
MTDWLGKLGDAWEAGEKVVGVGVDKGTDVLGEVLDHVGAEGVADTVTDWGDSAASALGAEVGEKQLGQSEEPAELIHGQASKITASAKNLRDFSAAFNMVGAGMKGLDDAHWKGEAADAYRETFQLLPTDWLHAADAFEAAAAALTAYAATVTAAQGIAKEAVALFKQGIETSQKAVDAHNKKVDAYNKVRTSDAPLPEPGPFTDPGQAQRDQAQEILENARRQRNEAAERANQIVTAALAHAPAEKSAMERAKLGLMDLALGNGVESMHFVGGAVKGTVGLTNFVRSLNPLDGYNITHPAEFYENVNMTLAGVVSSVAHPDRALKDAWEGFKEDPHEFLGRMLPEAVGTKGAGGLKSLARRGVDDAKGGPGKGWTAQENDPHDTSRTQDDKTLSEDPVDMATGRMVLPQTDLSLPGSLPLLFTRTFESSYRTGRWFGPTWASTADQRLEINAEGIVFLCEDGSLLAYPHPAPGVPVMPNHGRRWPLDRDRDTYTVTDPGSGRVWHFTEQDPDLALLTQIDDRNGRWITFEYDQSGAPTSIVHHGGYHLKLTTDQGRITALHLAGAAPDGTDQEILRYGYADGHLTSVTNSSGRPLTFGYDEYGRITSWTDTNGSHFDYVYDEQHRCVYHSGSNGHLESHFTWDDTDAETGLRQTSVTDALGHTTRYLINARVQVVAEIDPLGAVVRSEYDHYNRLLARTDALGHVTRFAYDEQGRLTELVRPDGRPMSAEYNSLGLPVRVRRTDGTVVRQTYDEKGNRTSVTDPTGATTAFAYDTAGHLTTITDALGHSTALRCDRAGLPLAITDPLGATVHYERDAFGRPVTITDPLGSVSRLEWTVEGRLARRIDPDGTEQSWTYDGEGNCLSHTDATGSVTRFEYTDFDLLTARTGPDGVRYEFSYDTNLRLTRVTNPQGLTWDYTYDPAGRLTSETDFDGRVLTYAHDASGRLISRTNGLGQTIRFERDALGRIVHKDAEGAVTTFEYDVFDELAMATGPDATLVRLRDRHGRLQSETVNGARLEFSYDALGRRTGRTTPTGAVSEWTYDAAGRRTGLVTAGRSLTFTYDAAGREVVRHIGDSVTLTHVFDPLGRLTDQHVTGGGRTVQRRAYTYRADGNLIGIQDRLSGTRTFDVDVTGRVTAVHAEGWTERYAYDEAGNQTEASWPASHPGQEATGPRTYTGTRIARGGGVRYEHDGQGRIVLRQKTRLSRKPDTWRYEWDAEDRLVAVTTPDGTRWRYHYDALGRRIAKQRLTTDGAVVEQVSFTWEGTTLCEQTTRCETLPSPVTLTWDHKGLRPLAQTERKWSADASQETINERFFAIVTDLIGKPMELVDESGTLAWFTRSTLWGATAWASSSTAYTPLRFPGQYHDPETELHYNYHRHYDPETARYCTVDPLGLSPAPNPVTYATNPHHFSDPLGLSPCRTGTDYMSDNAIPAGAPVTHGPTATSIGADGSSTRNFENVLNEGEHDVIAHGSEDGYLALPGGGVNGGQIVDAVTNNPHYQGGPLRLMVCHSGADTSGIAQQIANELGVTVRAPTNMVGTDPVLGRGQVPQIAHDGYWRVFLPIVR